MTGQPDAGEALRCEGCGRVCASPGGLAAHYRGKGPCHWEPRRSGEVRVCRSCLLEKPIEQFKIRESGNRRPNCNQCLYKMELPRRQLPEIRARFNAKAVERYRADPSKEIARSMEWNRRNPERMRWNSIKSKYGITQKDYDALLLRQGGVCATCSRRTSTGKGGRKLPLHIDHDHKTGAVRGLLCSKCNFSIGHAFDDPVLLRSMAAYVESPK